MSVLFSKVQVPEYINLIDVPQKGSENPLTREYDLEALQRAVSLVEEIFADFIIYEPDAPEEARIIEADWYKVTKKDKRLGLSNLEPGTEIRHWVSVTNFAKVFFDVLDNRKLRYSMDADHEEKSMDIVSHLIAYDVAYKLGHSRFIIPWRTEGKI